VCELAIINLEFQHLLRLEIIGPAIQRLESIGPAIQRLESIGPAIQRLESIGPAIQRLESIGPAIQRFVVRIPVSLIFEFLIHCMYNVISLYVTAIGHLSQNI
jgi:hypothetical protein